MNEAYPCGTFEDTVYPRWTELRKRIEWSRAGFDTWDFTASPPEAQQQAHLFLDVLEQWMNLLDAWDKDIYEAGRLAYLRDVLEDLTPGEYGDIS